MDESNATLFLCFDYSFVASKMHTNFTFEDMVYSKHSDTNWEKFSFIPLSIAGTKWTVRNIPETSNLAVGIPVTGSKCPQPNSLRTCSSCIKYSLYSINLNNAGYQQVQYLNISIIGKSIFLLYSKMQPVNAKVFCKWQMNLFVY